jgi:hypothetical protein
MRLPKSALAQIKKARAAVGEDERSKLTLGRLCPLSIAGIVSLRFYSIDPSNFSISVNDPGRDPPSLFSDWMKK